MGFGTNQLGRGRAVVVWSLFAGGRVLCPCRDADHGLRSAGQRSRKSICCGTSGGPCISGVAQGGVARNTRPLALPHGLAPHALAR